MGVEILGVLLTGGTGALLIALVQAWRTLRQGAKAEEKDYLEMADERRRVAEVDRDVAIGVANYWKKRAGVLEYLLERHAGSNVIPEFPKEPGLSFSYRTEHDTRTVTKDGTFSTPPMLEEEI